ncbi:response regulator transcription factor [Kineosporia sp. NBRC 101731]|uniref:response regulator n=1 Tax=Kineosporia sp. NBRC 101731 TaxID=3032199 RepID=UPI0024A05F2E|nr:response regulator transcription factor [Kineosporia sp. NBRC 101731]GLY32484.1 DNA-binding response regulator [Kineosporia sp. NBRC 101731]
MTVFADSENTRIALVDDHSLLREGLRQILETQHDFEVVGEAESSPEAVSLVERTQPDVVLLDVEIPGNHVTVTVQQMREVSPLTMVVVLSMFDSPQLIRELIDLQIHAYLLKTTSKYELIGVVRAARPDSNRCVLSVSRPTLEKLSASSLVPDASTDRSALTERELEVLRLTAEALSNAQIATRLGVPQPAIKRHLRNIFVKLDAVSRIDAVNRAVAAGLIGSPAPATGPHRIIHETGSPRAVS